MRPSTLPESQRPNFAKLFEGELLREQEEAGVRAEEAFLRVTLRTYGFDPDEGFQTDGSFDCGFDFVYVTQEETSIFQSKTLESEGGIPLNAQLDASYLGDLRRIIDVLKNLDKIPKEANKDVVKALISMRSEINRRALLPARTGRELEGASDVLVSVQDHV